VNHTSESIESPKRIWCPMNNGLPPCKKYIIDAAVLFFSFFLHPSLFFNFFFLPLRRKGDGMVKSIDKPYFSLTKDGTYAYILLNMNLFDTNRYTSEEIAYVIKISLNYCFNSSYGHHYHLSLFSILTVFVKGKNYS